VKILISYCLVLAADTARSHPGRRMHANTLFDMDSHGQRIWIDLFFKYLFI